MNEMRWQWGFLVVLGVLILALGLRGLESRALDTETQTALDTSIDNVQAYFPPFGGMTYYFVGEGMEYASFSRRISHVAPGLIQIEDLSGTNLAQVVEVTAGELRSIWSEEEFYGNESLFDHDLRENRDSGWATDLIFLQAPLIKGHAWSDERYQREIVATDQTVTVPLGVIHDVVVVKNTSIETEGSIQYEYYAKNIGLIKREALFVHDGETFAVVSSLRRIAGPFPQ